MKVTESEDFPLPYCGHRWCKNEKCVNRAEMIWSGYIQFMEVLNKRPKSKQPQRKSFPILQDAIKDPLIPAKLKLIEFTASKLNCLLRGFQTDQPMVSFLFDVLKDLLTPMTNMFNFSGRCKNVNTNAQTKSILQETIQWIIDITDTCFTELFDWIYEVKIMTEILLTWQLNRVKQNSNWVLCCYPYTKQFWFFFEFRAFNQSSNSLVYVGFFNEIAFLLCMYFQIPLKSQILRWNYWRLILWTKTFTNLLML